MATKEIQINYTPAPTIQRFHRSDDFVRCLMGPFGSGKSVGCVAEILGRAREEPKGHDGIRRSRWAVIRNSYRELKDTSLQTWNDWVPPQIQTWVSSDMTAILEAPGELRCEVLFRALDRPDDIKKLLSLELTAAWINEAREVPKAVFDAIQGRVGRYRAGGAPRGWSGIILDTNPPDTDHWIYSVFEEQRPAGHRIWHQPSGLSPDAENTENLPQGYYERLAVGKDQAWVDVYVHGQYGFVRDGKPIHPNFSDTMHTAEDPIEPEDAPFVLGIDFGLTPAATISQDIGGQWRVLDEVVSDDFSILELASPINRLLRTKYQGLPFEAWGDPAGSIRSQTDKQTPFDILAAEGIAASPTYTNDPTIRIEAVNRRLRGLAYGKPSFLLSPTCKVLRKALMGGYKFRRLQVSGDERFTDVPDKNMYSHVAESLQYAMLGAGEGHELLGGARTTLDDPDYRINLRGTRRDAPTGYGYRRSQA